MLAKWISSKLETEEESREVIAYGLEMIFSFLSSVLIVLGIGLLLHHFFVSVIFLTVFILLRRATGGFHASTRLSCFFCLITVFLAVVFCSIHMPSVPVAVYCIFGAAGFLLLLWKAPVVSPYKPLSKQSRVKHRMLSVCLFLGMTALGCVFGSQSAIIGKAVFFSLVSVLVLVLIPAKKHKEEE